MNLEKIEKIEKIAKDLHKHSIIIKDEYSQDKLMQIITNTILILDKSNALTKDEKEEVERVKRRIPKWFENTKQYNSIILYKFMELSNGNKFSVGINELEEKTQLKEKFKSNYNQMKRIFDKNHAKVFEEKNGYIELWKPVEKFIIDLWDN
ncbi:MAG: hypothetical protein DRQ78_09015 [Epsilonproteobacteria bacterium]|nr:MAG: hypothetical protein DRQ78_09015 [Campylobacterota bacterium]